MDALADWSPWAPFATAVADAPRLPGVYLLRLPATHDIVYAGMAGERAGGGNGPQGLRGRLTVYARGRAAVSGFGEAALDRALADPAWLRARLKSLETDGPRRAKLWAKDAISHLAPDVRWAATTTAADARALEDRVVALLAPHGLWNRMTTKPADEDSRDMAAPDDDPASNHIVEVQGHTIDLDVLYREMHRHSHLAEDGSRLFAGNAPGVPAMKRLLHTLFGVPVADGIDPVNDAVRSAVRDRLRELGWAAKDPGRSGRYVLLRDV